MRKRKEKREKRKMKREKKMGNGDSYLQVRRVVKTLSPLTSLPTPHSPLPTPLSLVPSPKHLLPTPHSPLPILVRVRSFVLILCCVLLLANCSSLVQKGGEILEGSAFAEKTSAVYKSQGKGKEKVIELRELKVKTGEEAIEVANSAWPGLKLRGGIPDAGGSFEITEARILSSHVNGWNEFSLQLLGSAVFQKTGNSGGLLRIAGKVERVQITAGKIRLKSNRLTGETALTPLRNRRERILALTEWMKEQPHNITNRGDFSSQDEFEDYWKPVLFPELVSKRKQPPDYSGNYTVASSRANSRAISRENPEWGWADSVRWNHTYTESLFPEGLWELRNTGAMLRDWEEALPWIFIEYSWDLIINSFSDTTLVKTKG